MTYQFRLREEPFEFYPEFDNAEKSLTTNFAETWQGELSRKTPDYIRWVQRSVNQILGLQLAVDGDLRSQTRSAIRSFQQRQGLKVDGIVGSQTESALIAAGASPPPGGTVVALPVTRLANPNINTPLPRSGPGFYSYKPTSQQYGLTETIQALQAIGSAWQSAHPQGPRIGIGDISLRGGGSMRGHKSHQKGVDIDIRLIRNDGSEESTRYQSPQYSRAMTQDLINRIRANGILGVRYIFFNDPRATGVKPWPNHDNHLHVRFIAPGTPSTSELEELEGFDIDLANDEAAFDIDLEWEGEAIAAPSVLELKNNIGRIAKREWERWGRGAKHETDPGMRRALRDYWQAAGHNAKGSEAINPSSAWSAAFVSYVMKEAGAGDAFRRSGAHRVYVTAAKRAFKQGDASKFWAYDITKVKPEVGDLVCRDRSPRPASPCGSSTYDNVDDGRERATHCDIVTEVGLGFIMVIGGNTSGPACPRGGCTVGLKKIKLDSRGFVIPDQSTCKYFAVVKPPVQARAAPSAAGAIDSPSPNRKSREYIQWAQQSLNRIMGLRLDVDGDLRSQTRSAIRSFQQQYGLLATGEVDQATNTALIQRALEEIRKQSLFPQIGVMDNKTFEEIKRFQSENGLKPDGLVGRRTRKAMVNELSRISPKPTKPVVGGKPYPEVNTPMPQDGLGFIRRKRKNQELRSYGLPETIQALQEIAAEWHRANPRRPRIVINDISPPGGSQGKFEPHSSHRVGLDVDLNLEQGKSSWYYKGADKKWNPNPAYSRSLTKELADLILKHPKGGLMVNFILFNDPEVVSVNPKKVTKDKSSPHYDHFHVRFCAPDYFKSKVARYDTEYQSRYHC